MLTLYRQTNLTWLHRLMCYFSIPEESNKSGELITFFLSPIDRRDGNVEGTK